MLGLRRQSKSGPLLKGSLELEYAPNEETALRMAYSAAGPKRSNRSMFLKRIR